VTPEHLRLEPRPPGPLSRPPDRGPLLTAQQVADLIGGVSPSWVRRKVPNKVTMGHSTVRWFKYDVLKWLEGQRDS
jgi:predicted DNA-binding transcriptional regulator AlpA